jgi:plastocyanin
MSTRFFTLVFVLLLLIGVLVTRVDTTGPAPFVESAGTEAEPLSGRVEMTIQDFHHHPNQLIVKQGSVLVVTNLDDAGQSLISDDKSLDTGILGQGESAELTLEELGKFTFFSEPYPNLTGTITVIP